MKTELKAKFIQHLLGKKKDNEGFTLLELLVVIIIIGILSAIALPSFLNQGAKAKQSEAKIYISLANKTQQTYRTENASFAGTFTDLQIGIPTATTSYNYALTAANDTSTSVTATSQDAKALKSFSGGIVILTSGQTSTIACQTTGVTTTPPTMTLAPTSSAACSSGENMK